MALNHHSVQTIQTKPFEDQKPGTSGLRKPVCVFQQQNYSENFIQAIHTAVPEVQGGVVVVGGDGRYFMTDVVHKIIAISAANRVRNKNRLTMYTVAIALSYSTQK